MLTRRFFLGGLASAFALGPRRIFSAPPGAFTGGKPVLSFGALSDVHVCLAPGGEKLRDTYNTQTLEAAFTWFRDNGVDAVTIAGDMAHSGLAGELKALADTWFKVFPNDKAPDGRLVKRVFVFGNHDWSSPGRAKEVFPDEKVRNDNLLVVNPRKWWDELFHEEWTPMFEKDVNGYTFIGAHWCNGGCNGKKEKFSKGMKEFYAARKTPFDPAKPFFHIQHPHPRDTVHGEKVWGQDDGVTPSILSAYSNAIAFSGHSHTSLTDERAIWQGAFTSVGCASLRNVSQGTPGAIWLPGGLENARTPNGKDYAAQNGVKAMAVTELMNCRQGQLVRVYADRVVFSRREFVTGAQIGDDLVMPLPAAEKKPFAFASRAAKAVAPEFPADAKLAVRRTTGPLRATKKKKTNKKKMAEIWELTIPAATAVRSARAGVYEVTAIGADGKSKVFAMAVEGYRFPLTDSRATAPSTFRLACSRRPAGGGTFEVRAISCWGKKSAPLRIAYT